MPQYPFKRLDAYEREDKDFYFGREDEVMQLYNMTFQSDLLLVYGASGTGKTSLIQCGLANCFETYEWLPLTIRRGVNICTSLEKALNEKIGKDDDEYFKDNWKTGDETDNLPLARQIKTLRLKYFKPVYLIFDQFEELYIWGDKNEQVAFYQTVKQLLALNQPLKIIISMREEYYGRLYDFEKEVPDIYRKKLRVEQMGIKNVKKVLEGVSKNSLVTIRKGEVDDFTDKIFKKLDADISGMDLPCLQILFDRLYMTITNDTKHQSEAEFSVKELEKIPELGDILLDLLNSLVKQCEEKYQVATKYIWSILTLLTSSQGTKQVRSATDICNRIPNVASKDIENVLSFFAGVQVRILQDKGQNKYEFRHDALANRVYASNKTKINIEKQISRKFDDKEYLAESILNEIELNIKELNITEEQQTWIDKSWEKIKEKEIATKLELEKKKLELKKKKQLLITSFALAAAVVFLLISGWLGWQANIAKTEKENALKQANKLISAFYFYDGKFALANKGEGYFNYFYFIDTLGNPVKKLGRWKKAEQFDDYTGWAKVINYQDETFLLDTAGTTYRYADRLEKLNDQVEALDLSGQGLIELPDTIGNYINLKYLYLRYNQLTELPPEIGKLTNLTGLGLYDNQLTKLPPEIGKLTNLTRLSLANNKLTKLPTEIGKLTNLTELSLSNNQLTKLPPEIGKLTNLTELYLYNNQLTEIPSEIGNLTNLTELYLDNNQLTKLPPEIENLTNLEYFSWFGNPLDEQSVARAKRIEDRIRQN